MAAETTTFVEAASRIGHRLLRSAERNGRDLVWRVVVPEPGGDRNATRLAVAMDGLYQGGSGIALFLGELWAKTGEKGVLGAARATMLNGAVGAVGPRRLGLYSGEVGVAYAAARLAHLTGDEAFADVAHRRLHGLDAHVQEDVILDVIGGAAGAILGLLAIEKLIGLKDGLALPERLGDHLLRTAQRRSYGWSWPYGNSAAHDLCGYAHGASGIAHAFLELFARTGDARWSFAALQAMSYEREHAIAGTGDWPDFRCHEAMELIRRESRDDLRRRLKAGGSMPRWIPTSMRAWCHGAPGIALTRIRAVVLGLGLADCDQEARRAISATRDDLTHVEGRNYSLCHGVFGNAETLLLGHRHLGVDGADYVSHLAHRVVEDTALKGRPWLTGVIGARFDPSLLVGEAGIGHFLLQLADPDMPSVLCLSSWQCAPATTADRASACREELGHVIPFTIATVCNLPGAHHLADRVTRAAESGTFGGALAEVATAISETSNDAADACVREAYKLDMARIDAELSYSDFLDHYWHELALLDATEIDWEAGEFRLSAFASLVTTRWDWSHWLR